MDDNDRRILRELKARSDIQACLVRYCRGLDRGDRELMMSAYHPDGYDEHGLFNGPAQDMVEWAISSHLTHLEYHHHHILNMHLEVDGDHASAETCLSVAIRYRHDGDLYDFQGAGRYLDRLECRDGQWKIAHRLAIGDWGRTDPVIEHPGFMDVLADQNSMRDPATGSRSKDDPSYRYLKKSSTN